MLGKLMKYEFQATQRVFLPLYGLILAFAVINKIFLSYNFNRMDGWASLPFVITFGVYCLLIAALFVMTLVVVIQRFQKNLLGDEGYLSFTLPVKVHSHIDSKAIVTLIWSLASLIVSALSIFLLAINKDTVDGFSRFCLQVGEFFRQYGPNSYLLLFEGIIGMLIGIVVQTLQIYASITVGNLNGRHRLLVGFGAYIGFGIVEQIVGSIVTNVLLGTRHPHFGNALEFSAVAAYIGIFIGFMIVFGAAFYFLINWLLKNRLNLE